MSAPAPKADFKLVLLSVNPAKVQSVVAELTELFPIGQKTALGAVQKAPIILIGGMTQQMAANLRTHLVRLGRLGAQLRLTADPVGKLQQFRWPAPPPAVLRPANLFMCPACGERFLVRPWQAVAAAPAPAPAGAPAPDAAPAPAPSEAAEVAAEPAPPPAAEPPSAIVATAEPLGLDAAEEEEIPEAEAIEAGLPVAEEATPEPAPAPALARSDELAEITNFLDSILKEKPKPAEAPPPPAGGTGVPPVPSQEARAAAPAAPAPVTGGPGVPPAPPQEARVAAPPPAPAAAPPAAARPEAPRPPAPQPIPPKPPQPSPQPLPLATPVEREPATEPMAAPPRPMQVPRPAAPGPAPQPAPAKPRPMELKPPAQAPATRPMAVPPPGAQPKPLVPPKAAAAPAPKPAPPPEPAGPRYDVSAARVRDAEQEALVRLLVERSGLAPEEAQRQCERTVVMVCKNASAAEAEEWRKALAAIGIKPRIRKH